MAVARCLASRDSGRWTPARLAAETGAAEARVREVLARLECAGLVAWRPGGGGYVLSRPVAAISVAEVVTAATSAPASSLPDADTGATAALTAAVWPSLVAALESVSLQDALPTNDAAIPGAHSWTESSRAVH